VNERKYFGVIHVVITAGNHNLVTWLPGAHVISQTQHPISLTCKKPLNRAAFPQLSEFVETIQLSPGER